jgi:hypothetical protein
MEHGEALDDVCAELRRSVERLDELAFDVLREAVASGQRSRPEAERRIVRARNAIERAISILEHAGSPSSGSADGPVSEDEV